MNKIELRFTDYQQKLLENDELAEELNRRMCPGIVVRPGPSAKHALPLVLEHYIK